MDSSTARSNSFLKRLKRKNNNFSNSISSSDNIATTFSTIVYFLFTDAFYTSQISRSARLLPMACVNTKLITSANSGWGITSVIPYIVYMSAFCTSSSILSRATYLIFGMNSFIFDPTISDTSFFDTFLTTANT